jgi:hypothetical protein
MKHIMIDIETLGVSATAPVIEIAAVPFTREDHFAEDAFYRAISLQDNIAHGRMPDMDTCLFWLKDPRKPNLGGTITLLQCMLEFQNWLTANSTKETQYWFKGTSFDPVLLDNITDHLNLPRLWKYSQCLDVRSIQKFHGIQMNLASHHPTDDCLNQIAVLHHAYKLTII